MPPLYRIKDWVRHFENSESRKIQDLKWVPVPNKHDGKSYRRVCAHKHGVQIFCAWCLMVEVASKMPVRGELADEDGPLTADDLACMTGFAAQIFDIAFRELVSPRIGWLELAGRPGVGVVPEAVPSHPETSGEGGAEWKGIEGKGIEDNLAAQGSDVTAVAAASAAADPKGVGEPNLAAVVLTFPTVKGRRDGPDSWDLREDYVAELRDCYPDMDVVREARKALGWVRAKSSNRKTADGMKRFLLGWMNRAQNSGAARKFESQDDRISRLAAEATNGS